MELCKPTIIVIAYNRDLALSRLLKSLDEASYPSYDINLIISIDKGDNPKVALLADDFNWRFGKKTVIKHPERLGLKKHVISCGNMVNKYDSVILLEDDLIVSRGFYSYTAKALEFSKDKKGIAGVSLYNHLLNVHAREPFEAVNDGYDNWYFQFASSWGQAFSKTQWQGFISYMDKNDGSDIASVNMPVNVSGWSDKSWLKYYIKYMIENDLYFIYPRISLTTNFSDEGAHADYVSDDLQVPMLLNDKKDWNFSALEESDSIYDAFFENKKLPEIISKRLGCSADEVVIDLYGYRAKTNAIGNEAKVVISSYPLPYVIRGGFGRHLRPLDTNVINSLKGEDIYIYDLKSAATAPKPSLGGRLLYNYRAFKAKYGVDIILYRLKNKQ